MEHTGSPSNRLHPGRLNIRAYGVTNQLHQSPCKANQGPKHEGPIYTPGSDQSVSKNSDITVRTPCRCVFCKQLSTLTVKNKQYQKQIQGLQTLISSLEAQNKTLREESVELHQRLQPLNMQRWQTSECVSIKDEEENENGLESYTAIKGLGVSRINNQTAGLQKSQGEQSLYGSLAQVGTLRPSEAIEAMELKLEQLSEQCTCLRKEILSHSSDLGMCKQQLEVQRAQKAELLVIIDNKDKMIQKLIQESKLNDSSCILSYSGAELTSRWNQFSAR